MKTPADKSPDSQRQAAAHEAPQQQASAEAEYEFVDNREEMVGLRQLQEAADNRPSEQGLAQLTAMVNNNPRSTSMQNLQAMVDNSPRQVAQRQQHNGIQGVSMGLMAGSGNEMTVQRVEDDELLQGEFAAESPAQLAQPPDEKPNNTGLPDNLKAGVESLSGLSLDNVKVHYNSSEPAQLNAHAYAQGTDIHVASGQEQHLPHEAWHVVQQAQGRVKPTMQMKDGVEVNDDVGLEREADLMGGRAILSGVVQARRESGGAIESDPIGFAAVTQRALLPWKQPGGGLNADQAAVRADAVTLDGHTMIAYNNTKDRLDDAVNAVPAVPLAIAQFPGVTVAHLNFLVDRMNGNNNALKAAAAGYVIEGYVAINC